MTPLQAKRPLAGGDRLPRPATIDLRSLRYLIAIVEEGSLAGAARRLGVTQSALTRSVQAGERILGVRLLDRGKHGATATVIGQVLVERGRHLLSDVQALMQEIDLLRGADRGEITIGAGPYPADLSVGTAVARLLAEKPGLKVSVSVADWPQLTESVLSGHLDIAVCDVEVAKGNPRLVVEPLPVHRGVLFCRAGHPLSKEKSVTLESIRKYPLALTALPSRLAPLLHGRTDGDTRTATPAIHVATFQLARVIVIGSDVIGGAVAPQIADDLKNGRVALLPIELPWLETRYGFIHRAGRTLAPSLQLFMDQVRAVEGELATTASHVVAGRRETLGGSAKRTPRR